MLGLELPFLPFTFASIVFLIGFLFALVGRLRVGADVFWEDFETRHPQLRSPLKCLWLDDFKEFLSYYCVFLPLLVLWIGSMGLVVGFEILGAIPDRGYEMFWENPLIFIFGVGSMAAAFAFGCIIWSWVGVLHGVAVVAVPTILMYVVNGVRKLPRIMNFKREPKFKREPTLFYRKRKPNENLYSAITALLGLLLFYTVCYFLILWYTNTWNNK